MYDFIHKWGYPNRRMNGLFHGESHKQNKQNKRKKGGAGDKTVVNGQNLVVPSGYLT